MDKGLLVCTILPPKNHCKGEFNREGLCNHFKRKIIFTLSCYNFCNEIMNDNLHIVQNFLIRWDNFFELFNNQLLTMELQMPTIIPHLGWDHNGFGPSKVDGA